ncbi:hypothetical protein E3O55_18990 [Cryobacterium sp. MDB1-18-2]|uniref:pentapeptide repeat-containing protein n=1 Tax=unclassified Cryobacterium TaxID=2649013 RepID=UPI00106A3F26|nr:MULTISPECIES: pentapeptide repeat-containing protein [unclassified Cryobacterium]TFC22105.1 hypothetical protein E3O55_18990 [Cryobacterium sp. MDB1-18-2]TFC40678.1 hypothetical protein E3O50_12785 [Cryobacterium sp. MDB1-18-1]
MNKKQLRGRWMSVEGRTLATEVAFRLVSGESFEGLDVGTHDGRVDLRGFGLPSPEVVGHVEVGGMTAAILDGTLSFRDTRWEGLDLSFAILPSLRFFDAEITDCLFDEAHCADWRLWQTHVSRCSFVRCNLRDSSLGINDERPDTWTQIVFDRADLRGVALQAASFVECDFNNVRLQGLQFEGCSLDRVRFSGVLRDVLFDFREVPDRKAPEDMRHVDFSGAKFENVEFRGCHFDGVTFPDDPQIRLIPNFPSVARRQLELLEGNDSNDAIRLRSVFNGQLRARQREDATGVFNRRDELEWGGESMAVLSESTLLQALAESQADA